MPGTQQRFYLAFHGDYSALKHRGFVFQKLYANNYMQWSLETKKHIGYIRIWKRGAEVTVDELTNFEGSFFQGLLALQEAGLSPCIAKHAPDCIEFIQDEVTQTAHFDEAAFSRHDAQQRAIYAYLNLLDNKYGHIEGHQARKEAAAKDGRTFPKQRYHLSCINLTSIKPVFDMIKTGWITVVPR